MKAKNIIREKQRWGLLKPPPVRQQRVKAVPTTLDCLKSAVGKFPSFRSLVYGTSIYLTIAVTGHTQFMVIAYCRQMQNGTYL